MSDTEIDDLDEVLADCDPTWSYTIWIGSEDAGDLVDYTAEAYLMDDGKRFVRFTIQTDSYIDSPVTEEFDRSLFLDIPDTDEGHRMAAANLLDPGILAGARNPERDILDWVKRG